MRFLPAVLAVALLVPGTAQAAPPATVTRAYPASTADIANPGRGFFTYTETHFRTGGHVPLDAATLAAARTTQARSLVFRVFYLEKYRDVDTIEAGDLALIGADFAAARAAGVQLVVRFAYTADSDADAPAGRVLKHVAQLGPILRANADILAAVQAGLIGRWGEWYYSRSFPAGSADRKRVLDALLAATSPSTPVQVRTPSIKRQLAPAVARLGVHNDCFLAGTDDYGTYVGDDRAWLARESATVLVGGETCAVSGRSGWANASAELAAYHWTYLNPVFHGDVLASWGTAGRAEASRRLGYRLRLVSAVLPVRARAGAPVTARIVLTNDGYAAPVRNRPVRLTLTAGAVRRTVTVPADVRTWSPGRTTTLNVRFAAPRAAGSYRLGLSLPDPAAGLATRPAYAIQLANRAVWDPGTGVNALAATLTVSS